MRHVGAALAEKSMKTRKKHIVAIGIAPWGVVHKRLNLVGKDVRVIILYVDILVSFLSDLSRVVKRR